MDQLRCIKVTHKPKDMFWVVEFVCGRLGGVGDVVGVGGLGWVLWSIQVKIFTVILLPISRKVHVHN